MTTTGSMTTTTMTWKTHAKMTTTTKIRGVKSTNGRRSMRRVDATATGTHDAESSGVASKFGNDATEGTTARLKQTLTIEELAPREVRRNENPAVQQLAARTTSFIGTSPNAGTRPPFKRSEIDYGTQLLAACAGLGLAYVVSKVKLALDTPSRTYIAGANTVGNEYDAWTEEKILEYYWGEHIHLGYYNDEDLAKGAGTLFGHRVKDFIEAKEDFVDEMYAWSGVEKNNAGEKPMKILDVGCGIGGATRRLASKCVGPQSEVTGITLSPKQAARATALAEAQNVKNAKFHVMDALAMTFEDDTFDMVWACESGEHMPDKKAYVEEMVRVLKPGGTLVIATWCQRHTPPELTAEEKSKLQFLYDEWAHPYFISIEDYCALAENTGVMKNVESDDWSKQTIVSWRHSIWAGVYDPMPVFTRPHIWYKTLRDIICLERMRRAFGEKLMRYGMIKGVKK
jgi:MPBQ/MSBQ methyltransferase